MGPYGVISIRFWVEFDEYGRVVCLDFDNPLLKWALTWRC